MQTAGVILPPRASAACGAQPVENGRHPVVCRYIVDVQLNFAWLFKYRINRHNHDHSHWQYEGLHRKQEIAVYILPIAAYDRLVPRRVLPPVAPTFLRLVSEVVACLVVYDFLFFFVHVACHKVPALYRHVHRKHHAKAVQRATEALRLTVVEQVLDVACSIAAVNVTRAHPLSRACYNLLVVYLTIELHCGYDMPWMLQNIVPGNLWGGSRRHDAHHRLGQHYYQKFLTYLDRLFGFEPPVHVHAERSCG